MTSSSQNLNFRGCGKRRRSRYDPYSWASSILARRSNVLCLGVSYPCVRSQLEKEQVSSSLRLLHPQECVEQAVELVRRNLLTQMDGRDLARCLALEASNETFAYTVSMEKGALYSPRHLTANFNRHNFAREIKKAFGRTIQFRQIILDYFWIPSGSWAMTHWTRSFFTKTLPSFVIEDLLDAKSKEGGVVFLPFCSHCVGQVVAAKEILSKYYTISFLYKDELSQHALWSATSTISPHTMQTWLGKAINQEDVYCTFTLRDVSDSMDDAHFRKEDVLEILKCIEDFDLVRMIKLQVKPSAIGIHCDPPGENSDDVHAYNCDAFIGLKNPVDVKRGIYQLAGNRQPKSANSSKSVAVMKQEKVEGRKKKPPFFNACKAHKNKRGKRKKANECTTRKFKDKKSKGEKKSMEKSSTKDTSKSDAPKSLLKDGLNKNEKVQKSKEKLVHDVVLVTEEESQCSSTTEGEVAWMETKVTSSASVIVNDNKSKKMDGEPLSSPLTSLKQSTVADRKESQVVKRLETIEEGISKNPSKLEPSINRSKILKKSTEVSATYVKVKVIGTNPSNSEEKESPKEQRAQSPTRGLNTEPLIVTDTKLDTILTGVEGDKEEYNKESSVHSKEAVSTTCVVRQNYCSQPYISSSENKEQNMNKTKLESITMKAVNDKGKINEESLRVSPLLKVERNSMTSGLDNDRTEKRDEALLIDSKKEIAKEEITKCMQDDAMILLSMKYDGKISRKKTSMGDPWKMEKTEYSEGMRLITKDELFPRNENLYNSKDQIDVSVNERKTECPNQRISKATNSNATNEKKTKDEDTFLLCSIKETGRKFNASPICTDDTVSNDIGKRTLSNMKASNLNIFRKVKRFPKQCYSGSQASSERQVSVLYPDSIPINAVLHEAHCSKNHLANQKPHVKPFKKRKNIYLHEHRARASEFDFIEKVAPKLSIRKIPPYHALKSPSNHFPEENITDQSLNRIEKNLMASLQKKKKTESNMGNECNLERPVKINSDSLQSLNQNHRYNDIFFIKGNIPKSHANNVNTNIIKKHKRPRNKVGSRKGGVVTELSSYETSSASTTFTNKTEGFVVSNEEKCAPMTSSISILENFVLSDSSCFMTTAKQKEDLPGFDERRRQLPMFNSKEETPRQEVKYNPISLSPDISEDRNLEKSKLITEWNKTFESYSGKKNGKKEVDRQAILTLLNKGIKTYEVVKNESCVSESASNDLNIVRKGKQFLDKAQNANCVQCTKELIKYDDSTIKLYDKNTSTHLGLDSKWQKERSFRTGLCFTHNGRINDKNKDERYLSKFSASKLGETILTTHQENRIGLLNCDCPISESNVTETVLPGFNLMGNHRDSSFGNLQARIFGTGNGCASSLLNTTQHISRCDFILNRLTANINHYLMRQRAEQLKAATSESLLTNSINSRTQRYRPSHSTSLFHGDDVSYSNLNRHLAESCLPSLSKMNFEARIQTSLELQMLQKYEDVHMSHTLSSVKSVDTFNI